MLRCLDAQFRPFHMRVVTPKLPDRSCGRAYGLLPLALALALGLASPGWGFDNVLLISIDTLRADHLGCYGAAQARTPNMDRLAARGVRFAVTVAPTPLTLPSHASLLTGLVPPRHGVRDNSGFRLAADFVSLAEVLHDSGYATGAFVGALPLDSRFGLDQGFDVYDDSFGGPAAGRAGTATPERPAEEVTDAALSWLTERSRPHWFAWVHFYDPHFPYHPPPTFRGETPAENYAGEVAFVDQQIGRLLAFLQQSGVGDQTLVVVTADHGESLGEHGELSHSVFAYEGTLRVPLILAPMSPRTVAPRVRLVDVAPTILELLGLSFPQPVDGASLVAALRAEPESAAIAYFEALAMYLNLQWAPLRGFYLDQFKYIELPLPELYDLESDPDESRNLCDQTADCEDWARRFLEFAGPFDPATRSEREDPRLRQQLQALGYLGGGGTTGDRTFGVQDDPKNLIGVLNRINVALANHSQGLHSEALSILRGIIDEQPTMSVAYLKSAAIYQEIGEAQKAIQILEHAVANGASTFFVERELGLGLLRLEQTEAGLRYLRTALRARPDDLEILEALGLAYLASHDLGRAEQVLQRAIAVDPSSATSHLRLGGVYLGQARWGDAIGQFQAAVSANPELGEAHAGLGFAYHGNRQLDLAIASWERALELSRDDLDILLNLAVAYLDLQVPTKAAPLLEEFIARADPQRRSEQIAAARKILSRI